MFLMRPRVTVGWNCKTRTRSFVQEVNRDGWIMGMTEAELSTFDKDGALVIDSPFTTDQLDRWEKMWDRSVEQPTEVGIGDPDFLDFLQTREILGSEIFLFDCYLATIDIPGVPIGPPSH